MPNWNNNELWNGLSCSNFTTPFPPDSVLALFDSTDAILDLGCGPGRTVEYLWGKGFRNISGVDVSQKFISTAREKFPGATFYNCDFLDFRCQMQFSLILLMGVIENVLCDSELFAFLNSTVFKHLENSGLVYLTTFTFDQSYLSCYIKGVIQGHGIGAFQSSKGFILKHRTHYRIARMVSEKYDIVHQSQVKFKTWKGSDRNGIVYVLRKAQ